MGNIRIKIALHHLQSWLAAQLSIVWTMRPSQRTTSKMWWTCQQTTRQSNHNVCRTWVRRPRSAFVHKHTKNSISFFFFFETQYSRRGSVEHANNSVQVATRHAFENTTLNFAGKLHRHKILSSYRCSQSSGIPVQNHTIKQHKHARAHTEHGGIHFFSFLVLYHIYSHLRLCHFRHSDYLICVPHENSAWRLKF